MPASADGDHTWDAIDGVTKRRRDHGFDIELGELGYQEEQDDVANYLYSRGRRSVRKPLQKLLAAAGLPRISEADGATAFGDNYYRTSVKAARRRK